MAHAFMVGGAEEIVLNLVRHLPARFEPMVCCIHEAGPIGEEIRKTGTPVAVLGLNPGMRRPAPGRHPPLPACERGLALSIRSAHREPGWRLLRCRKPCRRHRHRSEHAQTKQHHAIPTPADARHRSRGASAGAYASSPLRRVHTSRQVEIIYNAVDFS
jgi:hypothetical protein